MKAILAALLLASCVASKPTFPTDSEAEKQWKQDYRAGKITWSEYQEKLKSEKKE